MSAHMIVWGERSEQTQAGRRWISGLLQTPPLLLGLLRAQELDILNNCISAQPFKNVSSCACTLQCTLLVKHRLPHFSFMVFTNLRASVFRFP